MNIEQIQAIKSLWCCDTRRGFPGTSEEHKDQEEKLARIMGDVQALQELHYQTSYPDVESALIDSLQKASSLRVLWCEFRPTADPRHPLASDFCDCEVLAERGLPALGHLRHLLLSRFATNITSKTSFLSRSELPFRLVQLALNECMLTDEEFAGLVRAQHGR